jgi:flagellar biogenesis protein FliO
MFLQEVASSLGYTSLLLDLLRTLLALLAVCGLAWFSLRWLALRGIGGVAGGRDASFAVLRRLALGPRTSLYVVRAGKRLLLIGTGNDGTPNLIAELDQTVLEPEVGSAQSGGAPHA